jgi:D-alanyl-D-alanine carboxypeptidase
MSGLVIQDGSGLNLLDRMRPDSLYRFLELVRSEPYFSDLFSTLAIAGKAGTLLNRPTLVASSYTYSKIFAKTGTLNGVTNLAGYFWPSETATPEPFVVFTDSEISPVAARPMVDGIVVNFAAQNSRKK